MSLSSMACTRLRQLTPRTCTQSIRLAPTCFTKQSFRASRPFSVAVQALDKKYTEEHEWIELHGDGKTGTVGISTYAAKSLGDVVYVELPQVDQEVSAGDTIGAVGSVKSASDILSPVGGKITEANKTLEEKPGTINQSPEGDGWIAKIEIEDLSTLDTLMDKAAYDDFTGDAES